VTGAKKSVVREYTEAILVAVALALFLRTFIVQAFRIPTGSMEETLLPGDFLLVNKFLYGAKIPGTGAHLPGFRDPRPGDIIVFRAPHVDKDFIKRCVAVEGDVVELRNNVLYRNGERVQEEYKTLKGPPPIKKDFGPVRIPEGHVFMMGDNRNDSQDSRYWGPLDTRLVKGKAMVLYWSWDRYRRVLGFIPTPRFDRIGQIVH
jgi:signal peptidase I